MTSWNASSVRPFVAVIGIILCAGVVSCDPGDDDYEDALSRRYLAKINSSGFTPPINSVGTPGSCNGVTTDGGEMRVRFVLGDNNGFPIRLGEAVDNRAVQLTGDSVAFADSALMEVAESGACNSNDECSPTSNFTCSTAPGLDDAVSMACMSPDDGLVVASGSDAVEFIADTNEDQVYGLLMEDSGSLPGWNPPESHGAWDKNGDGDTSDQEDAGPQVRRLGRSIATDFDELRKGAVAKTFAAWTTAFQLAKNEGRKTFFGLWRFDETRINPTSHVAQASRSDRQWTRDGGTAGAAIDGYEAETETTGHRANVYEAIENLIDDQYSSQAMQDLGLDQPESVDKQLVVFVDGYDDLRDGDDVTIDSVIDTAVTNDVRLFIVHLDPKLEQPDELRDDPMYPSQQTPCTDDRQCKNYEACTRPRGYAPNIGDEVTLPAGASYDLSQTYCIPQRDDFGRTGPIADYARAACATGGGYMYVASADAIADHLGWTPLALDGLWEAKVASAEVQRGNVPAGAPLRVHTEMSVTIAGTARTYPFTQLGLRQSADGSAGDLDTRGVIFTAGE